MKDELCEWATPNQDLKWRTSIDPETANPPGRRRSARQQKMCDTSDPTDDTNGKPNIPKDVVSTLTKAIETKPIEICFACALPTRQQPKMPWQNKRPTYPPGPKYADWHRD